MKRRERKNYSAEEKVTILRRHLVDGVVVSELCDELNLQPTVFYRWQKQFFENGAAAFERKNKKTKAKKQTKQDKKVEALEKKLRLKDEVLAELMAEHVVLKKTLGEI